MAPGSILRCSPAAAAFQAEQIVRGYLPKEVICALCRLWVFAVPCVCDVSAHWLELYLGRPVPSTVCCLAVKDLCIGTALVGVGAGTAGVAFVERGKSGYPFIIFFPSTQIF